MAIDSGDVDRYLQPRLSNCHQPCLLVTIHSPIGGVLFSPMLVLGVNYTIFFDEHIESDLAALGGVLAGSPGPVDLDLDVDDSIGLASFLFI